MRLTVGSGGFHGHAPATTTWRLSDVTHHVTTGLQTTQHYSYYLFQILSHMVNLMQNLKN